MKTTSKRVMLLGCLVAVLIGAMYCWTTVPEAQGLNCNNNLRLISFAKDMAVQTLGLTNGSIITMEQVKPYLRGYMPKCPSGGTYSLNPVGQDPTCSRANPTATGQQASWHDLNFNHAR